MRRFAALAACLLATCAHAADFPMEFIHGGPVVDNRVHIMIASDGYTADDLASGRFKADAQAVTDYLLSKPPYSTWRDALVISRVDVPSQDSGISHPAKQLIRNTYFGSEYRAFMDHGKPVESRLTFLADNDVGRTDRVNPGVRRDAVVVLCNDHDYGGGSGGHVVVMPACDAKDEVFYHELGHALHGLADEYGGDGVADPVESPSANVSLIGDPTAVKWSDWVRALPDRVRCILGGSGHDQGIYHPTDACLMNTLGTAACPICQERMYRRLMSGVSLIESPAPAPGRITVAQGDSAPFAADILGPQSLGDAVGDIAGFSAVWYVDDTELLRKQVPGRMAVVIPTADLTPGVHTITLMVSDHSPYGCPVAAEDVRHAVRWELEVTAAGVPAPTAGQSVD